MYLSLRHGNNRTRKRARHLRVFLNDREVRHCFEVDTREGWVRGYARVPNGPVLVRHGQPVILQEHGRVRVERRTPA